jgi:hypothetical protein
MTAAESFIITGSLLIIVGWAGIAITVASAVVGWLDRRMP